VLRFEVLTGVKMSVSIFRAEYWGIIFSKTGMNLQIHVAFQLRRPTSTILIPYYWLNIHCTGW
jgi:hypothetical protein